MLPRVPRPPWQKLSRRRRLGTDHWQRRQPAPFGQPAPAGSFHSSQSPAIAIAVRRTFATNAATAHDASRVDNESARLVSMIGTRAPRTMPAASAPARKDKLLASMLP